MIFAIDPGTTTGLAIWDGVGVSSWQVPAAEVARTVAEETSITQIIIERYSLTTESMKKDRSGQYDALYTIGAVLYVAGENDVPVHFQTPSQMKSFVHPNEKNSLLKVLNWHNPGNQHANDAAGHLLKYMVDKKLLPYDLFSLLVEETLGESA